MPVHERQYIAGDQADLSSESPKRGLAGVMTNGLAGVGDTPDAERGVGEADGIARPAAPVITPGVGQFSVAFAVPTGADAVSVIVVEAEATGTGRTRHVVVHEEEDAVTPLVVAGLTAGTVYEVFVRGVKTDGRVGPYSVSDSDTPT